MAPSTTRWSQERVTFIKLPTLISPSLTIGVCFIPPMARIHASGGLMIAVKISFNTKHSPKWTTFVTVFPSQSLVVEVPYSWLLPARDLASWGSSAKRPLAVGLLFSLNLITCAPISPSIYRHCHAICTCSIVSVDFYRPSRQEFTLG